MTAIPLGRELLHSSAEAGNEPPLPVATYPQAWSSRPQAIAYLVLLRMEVAAFHPTTACAIVDSSLWPCSSPRGARPLAGILLCGARTFLQVSGLPLYAQRLSSRLPGRILSLCFHSFRRIGIMNPVHNSTQGLTFSPFTCR